MGDDLALGDAALLEMLYKYERTHFLKLVGVLSSDLSCSWATGPLLFARWAFALHYLALLF